jgi:hypothetical protein
MTRTEDTATNRIDPLNLDALTAGDEVIHGCYLEDVRWRGEPERAGRKP